MEINSPLGRFRSRQNSNPNKVLTISDETESKIKSFKSTSFNDEIDFDNLPEHAKGKVQDLPELSELFEDDPTNYVEEAVVPRQRRQAQEKTVLPEGAVELTPEQFNKFQKEKEKLLENQNKIDPKAAEALNALLGFGIIEKRVPVEFDGKKYIIYLSNLTEPQEKEMTLERGKLDILSLKAQDEGNSEDAKLNAYKIVFAMRKNTIKYSLKKIEFCDLQGLNVFSIDEVLNFFGFSKVEQLIETWGTEVINKLYSAYSDLTKEVALEINGGKLEENLKK